MSEPNNGEIMQAIGHLQGTVESIAGNLESGDKRMDSHSKRINAVERNQAWWAGAAAGAGALLSLLLKKIGLS